MRIARLDSTKKDLISGYSRTGIFRPSFAFLPASLCLVNVDVRSWRLSALDTNFSLSGDGRRRKTLGGGNIVCFGPSKHSVAWR